MNKLVCRKDAKQAHVPEAEQAAGRTVHSDSQGKPE